MSKAEEIRKIVADPLNKLQGQMKKLGRYFVFYTHRYEQIDEKGGNILVLPNDPRFDETELAGLCIDMVLDYLEQNNIEVKGNMTLFGLYRAFKRLYKEGAPTK